MILCLGLVLMLVELYGRLDPHLSTAANGNQWQGAARFERGLPRRGAEAVNGFATMQILAAWRDCRGPCWALQRVPLHRRAMWRSRPAPTVTVRNTAAPLLVQSELQQQNEAFVFTLEFPSDKHRGSGSAIKIAASAPCVPAVAAGSEGDLTSLFQEESRPSLGD